MTSTWASVTLATSTWAAETGSQNLGSGNRQHQCGQRQHRQHQRGQRQISAITNFGNSGTTATFNLVAAIPVVTTSASKHRQRNFGFETRATTNIGIGLTGDGQIGIGGLNWQSGNIGFGNSAPETSVCSTPAPGRRLLGTWPVGARKTNQDSLCLVVTVDDEPG